MEHTRSLDIAVIGNCRIAALVDATAGVVWMCWPRPDADPVFCALLEPRPAGADRGALQVRVRDPVRFSQQYLRNTAVLETIIGDSDDGEVAVTDFCPRFRTYGRMFRPPTLIRRVEPRQGRPIVAISLRPACDYGARDPAVVVGSDHLRFCGNGSPLRVTTDGSLSHLQEGQEFVLDRTVSLVLGADEAVPQQPGLLAAEWLAATVDYWRDWVRTLALPRDWQQAVIRAAITLKLCTYEDTGAVLAALTTSIPESPAAGRTWGRTLAHLAEGFAPLCLPAAGTHGLEIQHVDGRIEHPIEPPRQWPKVRVAVEAMALADPSLQIENKGNAIAVHYRATAHRAAELRRRMCELAQRLGPDYHVQEGLYLLELKPAAVNKGTALRTFMSSQPFAGRVPVAAGDDLSDLHAFRQAELLGGFGIAVGDRVEAAWRLPDPAAFRAWLVQIARAA